MQHLAETVSAVLQLVVDSTCECENVQHGYESIHALLLAQSIQSTVRPILPVGRVAHLSGAAGWPSNQSVLQRWCRLLPPQHPRLQHMLIQDRNGLKQLQVLVLVLG